MENERNPALDKEFQAIARGIAERARAEALDADELMTLGEMLDSATVLAPGEVPAQLLRSVEGAVRVILHRAARSNTVTDDLRELCGKSWALNDALEAAERTSLALLVKPKRSPRAEGCGRCIKRSCGAARC